jgi:hypothetical protein
MTEPADKTPEQSKTRFIGYPGSEMGVFAAEPVDRGVIALRAFFALTGRVVLYTLLAGAFAFFVFMSFRYPDGAVEQSLFVELSSGTALFLAAPFMLAVTAKRRPLAYTTLTTLSAVLALLAFHSEGLTQSFLVEGVKGRSYATDSFGKRLISRCATRCTCTGRLTSSGADNGNAAVVASSSRYTMR